MLFGNETISRIIRTNYLNEFSEYLRRKPVCTIGTNGDPFVYQKLIVYFPSPAIRPLDLRERRNIVDLFTRALRFSIVVDRITGSLCGDTKEKEKKIRIVLGTTE